MGKTNIFSQKLDPKLYMNNNRMFPYNIFLWKWNPRWMAPQS